MMRRVLPGMIAVLLLVAAVWAGVRVRAAVWEWTMPVRFIGDINNGFNWGREANRVGYLNVYEILGKPERDKRRIDYAPLRLGVMTAWVAWLQANELPTPDYPSDKTQRTRDYHAPLLRFNTAIEVVTSAAAAMLVWHVRRRSVDARDRRGALPLAMIAGMLVWFNPATVLEAHAWPQWDIWPMPFYLLALYCGLRRWWLAAGLLLGAGSMLKGQILMVAWTLPVWALFLGDWRAALRTAVGLGTAILVIGSPWALSSYDTATKLRALHLPALGVLVLLTLAAVLIPRRFSPTLVCAAIFASLYIGMTWLGGTNYWLLSGFDVGTWNYPAMVMGPTSNLPALLQSRWGWNNINEVLFTVRSVTYSDADGNEILRIGGEITMRTMMLSIFFVLSAVCAIRAAFLDRARDPRLLMALSLPWLMFFVFPCQIHERYLIFVSVCAATWVVCGMGPTLLGVLLTAIAFLHVILCMTLAAGGIRPVEWAEMSKSPFGFIRGLLEPTHPDIAWMLLLAVAILLYMILVPGRGSRPSPSNGAVE